MGKSWGKSGRAVRKAIRKRVRKKGVGMGFRVGSAQCVSYSHGGGISLREKNQLLRP